MQMKLKPFGILKPPLSFLNSEIAHILATIKFGLKKGKVSSSLLSTSKAALTCKIETKFYEQRSGFPIGAKPTQFKNFFKHPQSKKRSPKK